VHTTDSEHNNPIFPNLARGFIATGADRLWVADITYIAIEKPQLSLSTRFARRSRATRWWSRTRADVTPLEGELAPFLSDTQDGDDTVEWCAAEP
jgi:hypothetical protein